MSTSFQKEITIPLSQFFFYFGTLIMSLTTFRPVAPFFNGSDAIYLIAILLLIIRLLHEGKSLRQVFVHNNPFFRPLLIFLVGATLSLINSDNLVSAFTVIGKCCFFLGLWVPAGIYLIDTPLKIKGMLFILVIASLVPLIPAIGDFFFESHMTEMVDRHLSLGLGRYARPTDGRFGSVMGHPNNFGYMLVVVFPIVFWLIFSVELWYAKIFGFIFFGLIVGGMLATGSRSAALALSAQVLFFFWKFPKLSSMKKALCLLVLTALAAGILSLAVMSKPVVILDRFIQTASKGLGYYKPDSERIDMLLDAWQTICDHPIAGIGVEYTSTENLSKFGVHNTIFRLWGGLGIFGMIFILWVYYLSFHEGVMNIRHTPKQKRLHDSAISLVMLTSLVGWFLMDMVQPKFYDRYKFITIILLFALSRVTKDKNGLKAYRPDAGYSLPSPDRGGVTVKRTGP